MTLKRLPLGEWKPDQGDFQHDGLWKVSGAVSYAGAWHGCPGVLRETLTGGSTPYGPDECWGFHIHTDPTTNNGIYLFAGTSDRLLRTAINDATTANATAGALANAPDATSGWQFTSFGNTIAATQFGDTTAAFGVPMQWAATPGTNFATLNSVATPTTYDPIARYISSIKNHLLIGHVAFQAALGPFAASTVYPDLVMWSATDNDAGTVTTAGIHRWGDEEFVSYEETIGSGWQMLSDNCGPITAVSGNGDYAYVFKPRAIWRMDGPPWSFHPVVLGNGTVYPNSVVHFQNAVYFWGNGGPSRLGYGDSVVETLGLAKVSKSLTDLQNSDLFQYVFEADTFSFPAATGIDAYENTTRPIDISVVTDARCGLVAWIYSSLIAETAGDKPFLRNSGCVVYDVNTSQFSFFQIPVWFAFAKSTPRYSTNPIVFNGVATTNVTQSPVLDGVYGLTAPSGGPADDLVQVGGFFGDSVLPLTYGAQPSAEYPTFVYPYQALEEVDNTPISTEIKSIRIPFTIRRFAEEAGKGTLFTTTLSITFRVKSSMTSSEVDSHTITAVLSSISPDDWLPVTGVSGVYHQIEFQIQCAPVTAGQYIRPTSHIRNLRYCDIDFISDGSTGGTLPTV